MNSEPSPHVKVDRVPEHARYDLESVYRVLDRGQVAHIAFVDDERPFCIPTLYARVGNRVLVHGSSASRMIRRLAAGAPACLTVTILDGFVLARSAFEHSANYDSVVLLGTFESIADDHKLDALETFLEALVPGRWNEVRAPSREELKATQVLALAIREASVKTRQGPPDDDGSPDAALDTWSGVIPLRHHFGAPQPSPGLRAGIPTSPSVERLIRQPSASRGIAAERAQWLVN